jgi:hypothetical protein
LPFDRIPEYRFVVMARLVTPEETRKETVSLTVNDDPLIPDAMPTVYSHHADVLQLGGVTYRNLAPSRADEIPEFDPASLISVGEVARSGIMRDLEDFDATSLPEGTHLFRLPGYENLLVATLGQETRVYGIR